MTDENPQLLYCQDCMNHTVEGGNFCYDVCNKEITVMMGGIVEPAYEVKIKRHSPEKARAKGGFCGPEAKYYEYRDNKERNRRADRELILGLAFAISFWSLVIYVVVHPAKFF